MAVLDHRVALVTGAGRGIGRAIALRLASDGAAVVVNDIDEDVARDVVQEVLVKGGRAAPVAGSVGEQSATDAMVAAVEGEFGALDLVVNNAGLTSDAMLHKMSDAEWDRVVDVVLRGTFNVCRSAARLLRAGRGQLPDHHRKVVNIASINGIYGTAANANYSAAKAGVIGLTKALAREWAPQHINVNAVAPGYIKGTRLTSVRSGNSTFGMPAELVARVDESIPIGRPGTAEDIAGVVAFLCAPDSDYVTGQVLEVHGGMEIITLTG